MTRPAITAASLTASPMPVDPTPERTIPRHLHMVWVGSAPPTWARWSADRWREHLPEGWDFTLWDEATTRAHPHPAMRALPTLAETGQLPARGVADLVRLWAVSLHGGVYLDLDTLPIRPHLIEELAGSHPHGWLGERPTWTPDNLALTNAHFAAPRHHPFLAAVWERAHEQLCRGVVNEHFVAGPRAFAHVHRSTALPHNLPVRTDLPTVSDDTLAVEVLAGRIPHSEALAELSERYADPPAPLIHVVTRKSRLA